MDGTLVEPPYRAARRRWHALRRWALHPGDRLADRRLAPRRWIWFLEIIAGWAVELDPVVEPADLWHGFSYGSLPALVRHRRRLGGRAIYDARDAFVLARSMATANPIRRRLHLALERRWARRTDALLTVNAGFYALLVRLLGITPAAVVVNCPDPFVAAAGAPRDRIRAALGLPPETAVVLYQGALFPERGIEQGVEAILDVPGAVFVCLGYGPLRPWLNEIAARPPYAGRVHVIDAVPPGELLGWTAAADVILVAIQPTTENHRYTTPNKLFEALAAGVPVVASDLPGMAPIIRETGAGVLCDPTDPTAIAAALRRLIGDPEARSAMANRAREAARTTYNWRRQEAALLGLYQDLRHDLERRGRTAGPRRHGRSAS